MQSLTASGPPDPPLHTYTPITEKPRKASSACLACKQRKTRCIGGDPCQACSSRSTKCVYDASSDQRRKIANQRNLEELARRNEELRRQRLLLGGIVAIVRSKEDVLINGLLSAMQQDTDLSGLAGYVENVRNMREDLNDGYQQIAFEMGDDPGDVPPSPTSIRTANQPDNRYSHQYLMNHPIVLERGPWTILTSSELVSHLLSLFFTWEHAFFQFIDKSSFLIAFGSGDTSSKFCSKFLVHAILAQACLISRRAECKALQNRMFNEAKLYLEIEAGRASIATLQGLLIMHQFEGSRGRDRIGRIYRHQAVDCYRRLGFNHQVIRPQETTDDDWRAITKAIWGSFAVDALQSLLYGFSPTLRPPSVERYFSERPRDDLDERDGMWTPYPSIRPAKDGQFESLFHALCDLALIYSELNHLHDLYDSHHSSNTESIARIIAVHHSLGHWTASLQPSLRPSPMPMSNFHSHPSYTFTTESLPHVYQLNIFAQMASIHLFRATIHLPATSLPPFLHNPTSQLFHHCHVTMDLLSQLRTHYSLQDAPSYSLIAPAIVSYTLVAHLRTSPTVHPTFTAAVRALAEYNASLPAAAFLLAGLTLLGRQYEAASMFTEEDRLYLEDLEFPAEARQNVPMDMPILLVIGDNEAEREGPMPFDSIGDFLTRFSGVSLQRNLSEVT